MNSKDNVEKKANGEQVKLYNYFAGLVGKLGLDEDRSVLLTSALLMHGHMCGAMPLGFVAGEAALKALGVERAQYG